MNEVYIDVVLNAPADEALRELLSFQLHELGFSGFLETVNGFHCYIPKALWNDALHKQAPLDRGRKTLPPITISSIAEIENQNWNRQWEESIQPVEVSERIVITPSWHPLAGTSGKNCARHRPEDVVRNRIPRINPTHAPNDGARHAKIIRP